MFLLRAMMHASTCKISRVPRVSWFVMNGDTSTIRSVKWVSFETWKLEEAGTLSDSQILRSVRQTACCSRAWLAGSDHAANGTLDSTLSVLLCAFQFLEARHQVARPFAPSDKQILSKESSRCYSNVCLKGKSLAPQGERPAPCWFRFVEPP